jgi:Transposase, Mutator family
MSRNFGLGVHSSRQTNHSFFGQYKAPRSIALGLFYLLPVASPFAFSSPLKNRKGPLTRTKDHAKERSSQEDLRQLLAEDPDLLQVMLGQTVQQVLEAEREEALQAGKSERTETRLGCRAGYGSRTRITRGGKIELRVPPDRQGRFRTEVCERYQRREKALVAALLERYVQGVSTRQVKSITEELCGHEFTGQPHEIFRIRLRVG